MRGEDVGHVRRIGRAKASARRPHRNLYRFIRAGLEPRVDHSPVQFDLRSSAGSNRREINAVDKSRLAEADSGDFRRSNRDLQAYSTMTAAMAETEIRPLPPRRRDPKDFLTPPLRLFRPSYSSIRAVCLR